MNAPRPAAQDTAEIERLLGTRGAHGWGRLHRGRVAVIAGTVLALLAGLWFWHGRQAGAQPAYRSEPAVIGTLVVTVSATGKLQPTNQVDVGSELSGIVDAVLVEENALVRKGQVLARLDRARLEDAVAKSRANLATAEAQVVQAQATAAEARAALARLRHVAALSGGKVPSQTELSAADANATRADAADAVARAAVAQARAALRSDETNLGKADIRAPIDGMILTRKIEPGQTVAATFQAPVLFTLAENLTKMKLQVDIDEADVSQTQTGQPATFGVDAWPGRRYAAVITRVGYGAQVKDGVVSYPGVLQVDNADLSLRPGMTGTAEITTLTHANALLVPAAALRFAPPAVAADGHRGSGASPLAALLPRAPSAPPKPKAGAPDAHGLQRLWILRDGTAVPLSVKAGATNGRMTEITGGELKAGMAVITEAIGTTP